jgi:hypothetical protein
LNQVVRRNLTKRGKTKGSALFFSEKIGKIAKGRSVICGAGISVLASQSLAFCNFSSVFDEEPEVKTQISYSNDLFATDDTPSWLSGSRSSTAVASSVLFASDDDDEDYDDEDEEWEDEEDEDWDDDEDEDWDEDEDEDWDEDDEWEEVDDEDEDYEDEDEDWEDSDDDYDDDE